MIKIKLSNLLKIFYISFVIKNSNGEVEKAAKIVNQIFDACKSGNKRSVNNKLREFHQTLEKHVKKLTLITDPLEMREKAGRLYSDGEAIFHSFMHEVLDKSKVVLLFMML